MSLMLGVIMLNDVRPLVLFEDCNFAKCCYAEDRNLSVVMLSVRLYAEGLMLGVVILRAKF